MFSESCTKYIYINRIELKGNIVSVKCNCCGKFRKESHVVGMGGESDDCGNYETWIECIYCMAPVDLERYFKDKPDIINMVKKMK